MPSLSASSPTAADVQSGLLDDSLQLTVLRSLCFSETTKSAALDALVTPPLMELLF